MIYAIDNLVTNDFSNNILLMIASMAAVPAPEFSILAATIMAIGISSTMIIAIVLAIRKGFPQKMAKR